jgi:hypothetical protein
MKQKKREILSVYKNSHQGMKNTGLQKQDFSALLKALHKSIVNNAGKNLKSVLKKCGMYPCDASPLLKRLAIGTSSNPDNVESSFIKFLEEKRLKITGSQSEGLKRGRKKLKIEAGRSIAHVMEN